MAGPSPDFCWGYRQCAFRLPKRGSKRAAQALQAFAVASRMRTPDWSQSAASHSVTETCGAGTPTRVRALEGARHVPLDTAIFSWGGMAQTGDTARYHAPPALRGPSAPPAGRPRSGCAMCRGQTLLRTLSVSRASGTAMLSSGMWRGRRTSWYRMRTKKSWRGWSERAFGERWSS